MKKIFILVIISMLASCGIRRIEKIPETEKGAVVYKVNVAYTDETRNIEFIKSNIPNYDLIILEQRGVFYNTYVITTKDK